MTEDTAGATSVTSNRSASNKSEFEFVDNFKTPFSLRGQTPVSGRPVMMAPGTEASVTATKDLSDFFEETRRAKDLPVLLGPNENVERGEDGIARRCDGVRFEMQCNMQQHFLRPRPAGSKSCCGPLRPVSCYLARLDSVRLNSQHSTVDNDVDNAHAAKLRKTVLQI